MNGEHIFLHANLTPALELFGVPVREVARVKELHGYEILWYPGRLPLLVPAPGKFCGGRIVAPRQGTVEDVLGFLINYYATNRYSVVPREVTCYTYEGDEVRAIALVCEQRPRVDINWHVSKYLW